jgi:kynurenine aminotransferase
MWERTITVGSAGKTFGITGWRVGWLIGPNELLKYTTAAHARTVFCVSTPLQDAIAQGLEESLKSDYYKEFRLDLQRRRDFLISVFDSLGIPVAVTKGSFFLMANTRKIQEKINLKEYFKNDKEISKEPLDYKFCRWLTMEIGVTAIPPSSFYDEENAHLSKDLARFCFCKTDATLQEAKKRLSKLKEIL